MELQATVSMAAYAENKGETLDSLLAEAWNRVSKKLSIKFGDAIFRSWLAPLSFIGSESGYIKVSVPTRFMREWVNRNYIRDIEELWEKEPVAEGFRLELVIAENTAPVAANAQAPIESANTNSIESTVPIASVTDSVLEIDAQMSANLDPRYSFENFVVGKPNELAHAAARRVAESNCALQGGNPLFLYGGVGLGKTHLMHAIAWHIRTHNPQRRVLYLSAEKFMYQFIRALRFKEALAFKEHFRSVDVLMIDDVQFISGKDSTQEEFFHTFNALIDQNKQLVITGDRSPSDLEGIEERVRSRLGWGLVADIHSTSYELRLGILQSKTEQMQGIDVPQKVLEFLAHKITSNVRELEGALNRVVAHATLVGRAVTLETTQEVLHDLLRANDRRISIEDIQKQVANHYNVKIADMHSVRRSRVVARPRQVAMYLSKKLTSKSLPEIGRKFGGKDHTTVMHAVKKIEELISTDHEFSQDLEMLTRLLQS